MYRIKRDIIKKYINIRMFERKMFLREKDCNKIGKTISSKELQCLRMLSSSVEKKKRKINKMIYIHLKLIIYTMII